MSLRYLSVCSGIEAASVAWRPLGWEAVAVSEIDPFASAVLASHYPDVPNWGDMTRFQEWPDADVDVLVGGTPCQSFSVAGLRAGLADPRGGLLYTYLAIARRYRPRWLVWENVPGVLSIDGGRAFGSLLGGLAELGYGFAYRVLDAQYVRVESHPRAVPQRRRRVFVIGHLGDWRRAAAVLFERASLSGDPAPRRRAGAIVTQSLAGSFGGGGADDNKAHGGFYVSEASRALTAYKTATGRLDPNETEFIAGTLPADYGKQGGNGMGEMANGIIPYTLAIRGRGDSSDLEARQDGVANALLTPNGGRGGIGVGAVAFDARQSDTIQYGDISGPLDTDGHTIGLQHGMVVRRLTPRECERLQGFPDEYSLVPYRNKPAADGPRYKALGNSMAVPCMRWLGERIEQVEAIP